MAEGVGCTTRNSSAQATSRPCPVEALAKNLLLNGRLIDEYPEVFDQAAIDARSAFLAEKVITIWPGPEAWDVPDTAG